MKVEALVFDMDGLLLDSERVAEKHILKVYMAKIFRWISLMS